MENENDLSEIKIPKIDPDLANYIKQFQSDVSLDVSNLMKKSLSCSAIWSKWLSFLYVEKENLERLNEAKQKILKKKIDNNKNISDSVLRLKSEDKISENDETIKKINALTKKCQNRIDYIERSLNILSNFGYQIRACLELLKLNMEH